MIPPLLPVPDGLAKPTDELCKTCTSLRFTPRLFAVLPGDNDDESSDYSQRFGLVRDVKTKSSHCPLCRLVLLSLGPEVPDEKDGELIKVTFSWKTTGLRKAHSRKDQDRIPTIREIVPFVETQGGGFVDYPTPILFPRIRILANDVPTPHKSLCARLIKDQIDFAMVRNWIHICETRHTRCAGMHPDLGRNIITDLVAEIPSLRMIDVIDNCVIPAPHNCKYVALSYVWGKIDPLTILRSLKINTAELEIPGALAQAIHYDRIPLTIRDAMTVVKEIGMRYLWVDSLCIVQDDFGPGGSKMQAIAKMGLVYGAAALTIMAVMGDATTGLPGVRPGARRSQPIEEIKPGLRLAFMQMYQSSLAESVYDTRGWTFQEDRFSRRRLLFVSEQAVYSCPMTSQCREDEVIEVEHAISEGPDIYTKEDDISEVEAIITEYSGRSLTNISDIYDAIAAFLVIFQRVLGANLCHGIPEVFFDWFLLWESLALQTRRSGVTPSWSWSGWDGQSNSRIWSWYFNSVVKTREAQKKRTWVVWYHRKAHDSEECVRVGSIAASSAGDSSSPGRIRDRFSFDCSQTLPTPRKLIDAPIYIADAHNPNPGSGFLQFWTVSVLFDLDKVVTRSEENVESTHKRIGPEYGQARANICGRDGRELGNILLHPDWLNAKVPGRHEFVVLCEIRADPRIKLDYDEEIDKEPGWKYKIMLIEWRGEGQWAERVGLGVIEKEDLEYALGEGPVWKEIVLG
ncbi:hypothetical protein HYPSUDRAFT_890068 [Hypholoma sublateritium FD-334 SS-4]|uniref:Heterokaryon incompatibility domain-containing protein n=1 Tax=Hypholoma sublateritium (strain FD-334 SS-4) TaxID=945553 RepID=A0A0D2M854_HYPSF|nr:hypothetical protein HYPSUDRAFT_890068 [Hypholoma sublateritium FD-334 SS-4]